MAVGEKMKWSVTCFIYILQTQMQMININRLKHMAPKQVTCEATKCASDQWYASSPHLAQTTRRKVRT